MQNTINHSINVTIKLAQKQQRIVDLHFEIADNMLSFSSKDFTIKVPVKYISSTGRNSQTLILMLVGDQDQKEEFYDEEQQGPQVNEEDVLLFAMVENAVLKGVAFNNVIKGSFMMDVEFVKVEETEKAQKAIEYALGKFEAEMTNNNQNVIQFEMNEGMEEQEPEDIQPQ